MKLVGEEECECVNESVDSLSEKGYVEVEAHFWIDVLGIFQLLQLLTCDCKVTGSSPLPFFSYYSC